jgi:serine/threonine protein kinase
VILHKGQTIKYALKFIHCELDAKREADNICRIPRDPRVVRYYGCFIFRNRIVIGMELCDGDLGDFVAKYCNLSQDRKRFLRWDIVRKVAGGLHECHILGFMHRDIKPPNSTSPFPTSRHANFV